MKAWLQLLRISNLPTVWSNVLVGVVAGGLASDLWAEGDLGAQLRHAWPLMLAMSCLYLGGMALNDVLDVEHDRADAPHRPIVAGRVRRRAAAMVTACLFAVGLGLVAFLYPAPVVAVSGALVACIILYNAMHHRWPMSRQLMGVCRGLIVVTAALAVAQVDDGSWWWFVIPPALLLAFYTNVLTWLAAREMDPRVGPARRRVVLRLLAAMPLLDTAWLLVVSAWPAAGFCAGCAVLTRVWHRWVSGT